MGIIEPSRFNIQSHMIHDMQDATDRTCYFKADPSSTDQDLQDSVDVTNAYVCLMDARSTNLVSLRL